MWFTIIGLASVGAIWINSEPTIRLRSLYTKQNWFFRLINCAMCSTFWISILYTLIWHGNLDLFTACSSAVLSELISQKLNSGTI